MISNEFKSCLKKTKLSFDLPNHQLTCPILLVETARHHLHSTTNFALLTQKTHHPHSIP